MTSGDRRGEAVVEIESLARTGEGVAHVGERLVLVPDTMPGDRVRVSLAGRGVRVERAAVEVASPRRLVPPCSVASRCGGCTWQHVPAEDQRAARLDAVRRALPRGLRGVDVAYVPSPVPYGYRVRARLAWSAVGKRVSLGFRARASHDVVDAPECVVLAPALAAALEPLRARLGRVARAGEASVALGAGGAPVATLRPDAVPDPAGFAVLRELVDAGFAGAALYAPGANAAATAGDPRPVVRGPDGLPLWLAPEGFSQANEALNAALAEHVCARAAARDRAVLELFAGAGNFTVLLARDARRVTAVESDRGACEALAANVAARGIANVAVRAEDARGPARTARADVVVLDPPRAGAREVCEALAARPPASVVYVSCDPATLGRDLGALSASMDLASLTAFEMFPQTPHVETVASLRRRAARG